MMMNIEGFLSLYAALRAGGGILFLMEKNKMAFGIRAGLKSAGRAHIALPVACSAFLNPPSAVP